MDFKLEICCADLHSLRAAIAGGAQRVNQGDCGQLIRSCGLPWDK